MYLISFVIPVYNTGKYIKKCLESIYSQELDPSTFEIIIIDDGSTDNSKSIINEFINLHPNCKYYFQENNGQSSARNRGLKLAQGYFIHFIDSDDFLKENSLNDIFNSITNLQALDVIAFNLTNIIENKKIKCTYLSSNDTRILNGTEYIEKSNIQFSPCCYIFQRKHLTDNNLFFTEKVDAEDIDYIFKALHSANRIKFIDIFYYNINQRSGSVTRSYRKKFLFDLSSAITRLYLYAFNTDDYNTETRFKNKTNELIIGLFSIYFKSISPYRNTDIYKILLKNKNNCRIILNCIPRKIQKKNIILFMSCYSLNFLFILILIRKFFTTIKRHLIKENTTIQ